MLMAKGLLNTG